MYKHEKKFEYKMSRELAEILLRSRKGVEPQKYLCNYVNDNCGMMGTCVSVILY